MVKILFFISELSTNSSNSGINSVNLIYLLTFSLDSPNSFASSSFDFNLDTSCVQVTFFYLDV